MNSVNFKSIFAAFLLSCLLPMAISAMEKPQDNKADTSIGLVSNQLATEAKISWNEWLFGKPVQETRFELLNEAIILNEAIMIANFCRFWGESAFRLIANVYAGQLFECKTLQEAFKRTGRSFYPISKLDQSGLSNNTIEIIKKTYAQTGIDLKSVMVGPGTLGTIGGTLFIDPDWFGELHDIEQEFALAHECMHGKNKDMLFGGIYSFIVPSATFVVLKSYKALSTKLLTYLQNDYTQKNSKLSSCLDNLKLINAFIADSAPVQMILNYLILAKLYRLKELRADRDAALALNSAYGGMVFFSNQILNNYPKSWWNKLGFGSHPPHEERLDTLKHLFDGMNAASKP
jgi:hypothetical protein